MFSFFIHTHSDCKDLWPCFFGQLKEHFEQFNKYVCVDKNDELLSGCKTFLYEEQTLYSKRLLDSLKHLKEEIILFTHEDMILYGEPDYKTLNEYVNLIKNGKANFIKLLKCKNPNESFIQSEEHSNLVVCPAQYSFTVQPTLCKASDLVELVETLPSHVNIWDLERAIPQIFQLPAFKNKKCFMSSFSNESQRGIAHWDSSVYPHGNMIFKGKWTYSEYKKEIDILCEKYSIQKETRGVI